MSEDPLGHRADARRLGTGLPRPRDECGGCAGLGSHRRWCPETVGRLASTIGKASEACNDMADTIGSNDMGAANLLYSTSAALRVRARQRADEWRERQSE